MTPFSLALLALCTATAAGAIPVRRAPEPDMLTLSSASIVPTCDIAKFTWTLPSDNPNVQIANILVHNDDDTIKRSIAQPANRETSVEWTVDVPPGSYVVVADLAEQDESVQVVNAAFTVRKGADTSCLHSDETSEASPTTPAAPTTPPVAENVEAAPEPTPSASSSPSKGVSPGAIAGLIVGALILLVVAGTCIWRRFAAREHANEQYPLPPAVHRSKTSDDRRDSESTVVDIEVVARAPTPLGMASMTKLGRTQSKPLVAELDTEQTQKMLRQLK
ncbi:hypothetical protein AURDEDRAFT_151698 [Auricularia subglabra TFB-10046 SS5]|nr:hypothetical protein AURDEDRAFT_151698 [Auricularia subglabra TFB-10046 SS5]